MGERVYVKTARAEPIGTSHTVASGAAAGDGVRIDYAARDVNSRFPTFWRGVASVRFLASELIQTLRPQLAHLLRFLGGGRQILFAAGVTLLSGGLGCALSRDNTPSTLMALGGLAIGLTIQLPAAGHRREAADRRK